ncbi:inositol monophosphatase family protein [Streptomyces halstedii]|uniref:inositol monophosphatase family protein n=1 Tax=Streptomyces halstedii TaxID=1944 RepID=UPI003460ACF4
MGQSPQKDGTEVTEIDLAVEELVRNELARHMPEDGSYGEEKGSTAGVSGRRWIIDPINGTTSFTRRWPLFSNDIAYEDKCGPAVGVINMPVRRPRRRRATRQGRRGRSPRTVKSRNFRPPRR